MERERALEMMRAGIHQDNLKLAFKEGKITKAELDEKTAYWQKVKEGNAPQITAVEQPTENSQQKTENRQPTNYSEVVLKEINKLVLLLQSIDLEKAQLSQKSVLSETTDKDLSHSILKKRGEWIATKARLDFIKDTGTIPDEQAKDDYLPEDRYELQQLIDKTKFLRDNAKKRSTTSKTEVSRKENEIKYAQANARLAAMIDKLKVLNQIFN